MGMITVSNPCLSLHIEPKDLNALNSFLIRKLMDLNLSPRSEINDYHLSLCYLKGDFSLEDLVHRMEELKKKEFLIRPKGLKILKSANSSLRFLALDVDLDEVLKKEVLELNNMKGAVQFSEGFCSHISFMVFDSSELSQAEEESLIEVLEMQALGLLSDVKIEIKAARIFSSEKKPLADL